jgi:hypothetical protein
MDAEFCKCSVRLHLGFQRQERRCWQFGPDNDVSHRLKVRRRKIFRVLFIQELVEITQLLSDISTDHAPMHGPKDLGFVTISDAAYG